MTQTPSKITPKIAAEICHDGEANRIANVMLGSLREFSHRTRTTSIIAFALEKFPKCSPAEAVEKLNSFVTKEIGVAHALELAVQTESDKFRAENAPLLAQATRERGEIFSRAASLRTQIKNADARHELKIKNLQSLLNPGELAAIEKPSVEALTEALSNAETKISELDKFVASGGLAPVPKYLKVAAPVRVTFQQTQKEAA